MSASLVATVLLPLALAVPPPGMMKDTVEVAGRIESPWSVLPPIGYRVRVSNDLEVLADTPINPDGTYRLFVPPGDYSLSVFALGVEIHRQPITVRPECNWSDIQLPGARGEPPPVGRS